MKIKLKVFEVLAPLPKNVVDKIVNIDLHTILATHNEIIKTIGQYFIDAPLIASIGLKGNAAYLIKIFYYG